MFSQGRSAGFSAAEAVLVLLVAASNHIAIVRVIVTNALLWGNKPITEQTASFSRCSERLRWSVAFKNKQAPREKEDDWSWEKKLRINGNRADTLTLIVPSDEFQEKMRSTISAIAVRFVATCEKRLLSQ